ncbi:MAG: CHAT domain-containing protein [Balneolaceae bacterium]|nr:CHAT domain-containing protein [Balneolaceae bacterium]
MEYDECRLTIKKNEQGLPIIDYWDSFGGATQGKLQLDPLTKKTIQRFMHWAAENGESCTREDLKVLGLHLYRMLFDDAVRRAFDEGYEIFSQRREKNRDMTLRLKLTFHKDFKELAQYPWEFIFMPAEREGLSGEFLAKTTEMILTRFIAEPESRNIEKLYTGERPIRILVVSSHPRRSEGRGLDIIDADRFLKKINEFRSDSIVIEYLRNPTFRELRNRIQGSSDDNTPPFNPHIFHFIGHGKPGNIALTKDLNELEYVALQEGLEVEELDDAHWIDGETLSAIFPEPKPRFVFLNACSGAQSEYTGFNNIANSIARDLVCSDIPAVVAMQYEIRNDDANTFAHKVYKQLSEGEPIDKAIKYGVMELGEYPPPSWNHPRFGTPVFYLQAKDTTFLPKIRSEPVSNGSEPGSHPVEREYCPHCNRIKVSAKFKFCPSCRGPISECPECRKPISPDYNICPFCAYELKAPDSVETGKLHEQAKADKQGISIGRDKPGAGADEHSLDRSSAGRQRSTDAT